VVTRLQEREAPAGARSDDTQVTTANAQSTRLGRSSQGRPWGRFTMIIGGPRREQRRCHPAWTAGVASTASDERNLSWYPLWG
jgi:hypothetical protein